MAEEKNTGLRKFSEDQNPKGTNFDSKKMIEENTEKKTKVKFTDRVKVRLLKDTIYQKKGKEYSPHRVKAEALVEQKIAEYVK